jgi:hypothetical protein
MKKLLIVILLGCALGPVHANGQGGSTAMSNASSLLAGGSALVVAGSLSAVAAAGMVTVASVQIVGESVLVVLEGASEAASATVRLSGKLAQGVSIVAGTSVVVTVVATGIVLSVAGQVIGFVANDTGRALIHHSRSGS